MDDGSGLEDTHAAALLEADGADENICYASGPTGFQFALLL